MSDSKVEQKRRLIQEISNHPNISLLRQCQDYKDEYDSCREIKARFYQVYVNGEVSKCDHWQTLYKNCLKIRNLEEDALVALDSILDHEISRKKERLQSIKENDVWDYREQPPDDWDETLPEFMEAKKGSILDTAQGEWANDNLKRVSKLAGCVIL